MNCSLDALRCWEKTLLLIKEFGTTIEVPGSFNMIVKVSRYLGALERRKGHVNPLAFPSCPNAPRPTCKINHFCM